MLFEMLEEGSRRRVPRLTVTDGLLTDRLAPFPGFVPIGKKPLNLNTVSCPRLQVSEDLEVILTSHWILVMET